MSWKEVSEEMEKIEKIVGQMEEGTEEETDKKTKEKDKEKKKKERTEVAQIHMTDSANRKFFQKIQGCAILLLRMIKHRLKIVKGHAILLKNNKTIYIIFKRWYVLYH